MRKIYIVITFIICLFLIGCSKEESISIKNQVEILDFVYSGYLNVDRPEYDEKYKDYLYFQIRDELYQELNLLSLYKNPNYKLYEAMIINKKVIAGYISNETIKKMVSLYDGSYEYIMNEEKGYSSLYPIYSKLYQDGSLSLEKDKTYIYSFNDGIPLEYDDKKLVFVIEYYEVSLNDDKIITPIIYTKGRMIDNCYYCDVPIIYMDYGAYLYYDSTEKLVMSLEKYYSDSQISSINHTGDKHKTIYVETLTKEEFDMLSLEEQRMHLDLFDLIKESCVHTMSDYEYDYSYRLNFQKLKEILIDE